MFAKNVNVIMYVRRHHSKQYNMYVPIQIFVFVRTTSWMFVLRIVLPTFFKMTSSVVKLQKKQNPIWLVVWSGVHVICPMHAWLANLTLVQYASYATPNFISYVQSDGRTQIWLGTDVIAYFSDERTQPNTHVVFWKIELLQSN